MLNIANVKNFLFLLLQSYYGGIYLFFKFQVKIESCVEIYIGKNAT